MEPLRTKVAKSNPWRFDYASGRQQVSQTENAIASQAEILAQDEQPLHACRVLAESVERVSRHTLDDRGSNLREVCRKPMVP